MLAEKGRTIFFWLINQNCSLAQFPIDLFIYPIPNWPIPFVHCPISHKMRGLSHTGSVLHERLRKCNFNSGQNPFKQILEPVVRLLMCHTFPNCQKLNIWCCIKLLYIQFVSIYMHFVILIHLPYNGYILILEVCIKKYIVHHLLSTDIRNAKKNLFIPGIGKIFHEDKLEFLLI